MRILLINDNIEIKNKIKQGLQEQYHYIVDHLKNEQGVLNAIMLENFDIILPDLNLDLIKEIRQKNQHIPILLLANCDTEHRIKAFHYGADDCMMTTPFNVEELRAKIEALQRRFRIGKAQPNLIHQDVVLDPNALTVTWLGKPIPVSRREFALLKKLLENVGRVVSREILIQCLYGWREDIESNTLEVHTHNLRKKLKTLFIKTIRGVGYLIESEKSN